ncbi:DUF2586 domain-containing protein [Bacterioplanoides sp.]|uniref:DUF2586 domain-containing protein n=1 Tax=Bacterioplanoides sp. TaxID=2066072 RepID=UPI003B59207F
MSLGSVTVNNLNLGQGSPTAIECLDLFTGVAGDSEINDQVHAINTSTNLDDLLGSDTSNLKTQIMAAINNGGQNWFGYVLPLSESADLLDSVDDAVGQVSVESVVCCDPVSAKSELEDMHAKAEAMISKYQRRTFFQAAFRELDASNDGESWSDYSAAAKAITENVAGDRVIVVPLLYPDFLGSLAGRLANQSVSVADSPMRTATGSLVGNYAERPVDINGRPLDKSVLLDLHDNGRFTVPTWYEDYEGTYTSDGYTLAPETSDYRVIENLRVADKAARRIYLLAVSRIANRLLNSTSKSIAFNKTYFMTPLREMSHGVEINGIPFPGEIEPPESGDIVISWVTKNTVEIYFTLRPYGSPKSITANITLDLTQYADAA